MFSSQYTYISYGKLLQEPNKKLIHMYLCHDSFIFLITTTSDDFRDNKIQVEILLEIMSFYLIQQFQR